MRVLTTLLLVILLSAPGAAPVAAQAEGRAEPAGQLTWGINVSLAPTWFDPAETTALITPFMLLLRHPRRAGEADARQPHGPEPRRVAGTCPTTASPTTSSSARA